MNRSTSLYLDVLRFMAALAVFISHIPARVWPGGPIPYALEAPLGRPAVLIFFVLSGYVIAYVTDRHEHHLAEYAISRVARLYSVVIPALITTALLDYVGTRIDPSAYDLSTHDHAAVRLVMAATFTSGLWFINAIPLSNTPFWSLPFEAWYYVIFGCSFFLSGRTRIWVTLAAAVIAGPKILLYAPIWLAGVFVYRHGHDTVSKKHAAKVFVLSWIAFIALMPVAAVTSVDTRYLPWNFSPIDFLFAIAIAANIWSVQGLHFNLLERLAGPIRWLAGSTFALYLFHAPVMSFLTATCNQWFAPSLTRTVLIAIASLVISVLAAGVTEPLRRLLRRLLSRGWSFYRPERMVAS